MADNKKVFKSFTALTEDINTAVADKTTNEIAIGKVIQKRVDVEIEKRATLLEKGFDKYGIAVKDLSNCKPDNISHTFAGGEGENEGTPITNKSYSDLQMKKLQGFRKIIADLDAAFIHAIEGRYEPLQKLMSGEKNQNKSGENKDAQNS